MRPSLRRQGATGRTASRLRDLAIALSLSNLLHVAQWSWLLDPEDGYFREEPPHWSAAAVTAGGVLALGGLFFLVGRLLRARSDRCVSREALVMGFNVACLLALNGLRQQSKWLSFERLGGLGLGLGGAVAAVLVSGVLLAALLMRWRYRVARLFSAGALAFSPFVLLAFGTAGWQSAWQLRSVADHESLPPAPLLGGREGGERVVIALFDGLDQDALVDRRQPDLPLPAFDALRGTSLESTNAYPPSWSTLMSVPALTTGRAVVDAAVVGPRELRVRYESGAASVAWTGDRTVFAEARNLGFNAGLVGWYHPYCRLAGSALASCRWHSYFPEPRYTLRENLGRNLAAIAGNIPGSNRVGLPAHLGLVEDAESSLRAWHERIQRQIEEEAVAAACDPRLGLVFVHYAIPHDPYIYDRHARRYETVGPSTFADNLALADAVLGRLRRSMELAGLWEASTVIVTADHWNRDQPFAWARSRFPVIGCRSHRVPFLVKLPHQSSRLEYPGIVHTFVLHDLILAVLGGKTRTPSAAAAWLDGRASADVATEGCAAPSPVGR